MVTYEELQKLKKEIEQKHATSEHTREADVVVLTNQSIEGSYRVYEVQKSLEGVLSAWKKSRVRFYHATNACDAFWTRRGVSVFITDYFLRSDFSIFGPYPIGAKVARLYREDETAIVAIVSPYFNDYSVQRPDYRTQRYLEYWQNEYYGRGWTRPGVGSPNDLLYKLNYAGYSAFGTDEKGLSGLKQYVKSEINKIMVTIKTT